MFLRVKEAIHKVAHLIQVLIYQTRSASIRLENRKRHSPVGGGRRPE